MTVPQPAVSELIDTLHPTSEVKRFRSILFPNGQVLPEMDRQPQPECFADLNLDQIVAAVTAGRDDFDLKPFFYLPSRAVTEISYRHDVFRDLEYPATADCLRTFAAEMHKMRDEISRTQKLYYELQRRRCLLDSVGGYCAALRRFGGGLRSANIRSQGLTAFRLYLEDYLSTPRFRRMEADAQRIAGELGEIRYALLIAGKRITVQGYEPEPDYGADVLETFEKFRQGGTKERLFNFRFALEMNHVEAAILDRVARLYPDVFAALAGFYSAHTHFQNPVIAQFDREAQFYLAWTEHMDRLRNKGLSFCYPEVSDQSKGESAEEAFDLALADKLRADDSGKRVVTNDFSLAGEERILVVTGPNQGGKTTFARMIGQLHYLAGLGCPVPARGARLFLADQVFTHFEKEEEIGNLTGKLGDELLRIRHILELATPESVLIMNESFLSTTLKDALFLSREVMMRIVQMDMICVSVTFLDELVSMSASTVSMVGEVDREDPSQRTFRILRKPADGLAYAMAIAEKYRLTEDAVKKRIVENTARQPS
ncbi:MAG TPA: hypothetical protein VMU48_20605 [Terracidiphilus sp.]|nr:hypothetical protein [Terracidiphilus sp.]